MKYNSYRMEIFRQKNVQDWRTRQFQVARGYNQEAMDAETMKKDAMQMIEQFENQDLEEVNIEWFYIKANQKMHQGLQLNLDILVNQLTKIWVNLTYHIQQCYDVFEFCDLYCHQSMLFFDQFIKSHFYFEMLNHLNKGDNNFKIRILQLVNSMNDIRKHEINTIKLYDCLNAHIVQLKSSGIVEENVGIMIKQLVLILINCELNLRQEQALICLLNNYIIILLQSNKTFIRDQELIMYTHFISTKKSIFDEKTFELLLTLAFNRTNEVKTEEKAAAIGVIGQLMMGSHRQVMYYYEVLSKFNDLFENLLESLKRESLIVNISSAYTIANILKDKEFPINNLYQKGYIKQLFEVMSVQWSLEVQVEFLRACDMLIQNSDFDQLISLVTQYDLITLILKIDHIQLYESIYTCKYFSNIQGLYNLMMRFQVDSEDSRQQLLYVYKQHNIPQVIRLIYEVLPPDKCTSKLSSLNELLYHQ